MKHAPDEDPQAPHGRDVTPLAEHPLGPGPVQHGPFQPAGPLPQAAPSPARPGGRVPVPVQLVGQRGRRGHGGVQYLHGGQVGGPPVRPRRGTGQQLAEIADDVELGVTQARDEDLRLLPDPRLPAGGHGQPRLARPRGQDVVRDDSLDVPGVEPVGHLLGQRLVQPAQELDLGQSERGIGVRLGEVDAAGIDAENRREPDPERAGRALLRHGDHVHLVRRKVPRPHVEDGQRVVERPEPPLAPVGGSRLDVDDTAEPFVPGDDAAGLDRLLPLGGQQGGEVAHGEDDVHLGREQGPDRAIGLLGVARGQDLVRDDGRLGGQQGLADQDVPVAGPRIGRVGGLPDRLAQIPAGPVMVPPFVARQHDALGGEPGAVAPEGTLQERRARLRLADVHVDAGAAATRHPVLPVGRTPARGIARCQPDT